MITKIFPHGYHRYLSLPILGPLMDSYSTWLNQQQYTLRSTKYELRMAAHVCEFLKTRGLHSIEEVGENDLNDCYQFFRKRFPKEAGSVKVIERFLFEHDMLRPAPAPEPSRKTIHLRAFRYHLRDNCGYAPSTVQRQVDFADEFLDWLKFEETPNRLTVLSVTDVEAFIRKLGKRMGRVALQKPISSIRKFLRFLAANKLIVPGLDKQIDTPRVYRQERLPKSLEWNIVQAFLNSIDRNTAIGKRDYAMFSLMVTYGLRACDVVALKLDDIKWRAERIRICQSKTGNPLELPLTHEVSSAIYDYLKQVPRTGEFREVFLRLKAPAGILKSTAVTEAFQSWSRKSRLDIPFKGPRCLRHSYALHLSRHGLSLKTIGDLLGHNSLESTGVYIRLAIEDLRDVALHVPGSTEWKEEVQS